MVELHVVSSNTGTSSIHSENSSRTNITNLLYSSCAWAGSCTANGWASEMCKPQVQCLSSSNTFLPFPFCFNFGEAYEAYKGRNWRYMLLEIGGEVSETIRCHADDGCDIVGAKTKMTRMNL